MDLKLRATVNIAGSSLFMGFVNNNKYIKKHQPHTLRAGNFIAQTNTDKVNIIVWAGIIEIPGAGA